MLRKRVTLVTGAINASAPTMNIRQGLVLPKKKGRPFGHPFSINKIAGLVAAA
ncbi:MAG: hypothetical protein QGI93_15730 [Planctomycetota bacterium]|nr:hypothetical protein [Planctomycetota bacterium]